MYVYLHALTWQVAADIYKEQGIDQLCTTGSVCIYVCMYVCRNLLFYVCMYVCMYVCIYVCTDGNQFIVTFLTEHGAQPPVQYFTQQIAQFAVTKYVIDTYIP